MGGAAAGMSVEMMPYNMRVTCTMVHTIRDDVTAHVRRGVPCLIPAHIFVRTGGNFAIFYLLVKHYLCDFIIYLVLLFLFTQM